MRFSFSPRPALLSLGVAALVSWGLSHWGKISFFWAFAIVAGAIFVNGVIANREDESEESPAWRSNMKFAAGGLFLVCIVFEVLFSFVTFVDAGTGHRWMLGFFCLGLASALCWFLLRKMA